MTLFKCPRCSGKKDTIVFVNTGQDSSKHYCELRACSLCLGSGYVTQDTIDAIEKGKALRQERVSKGMTLREAALREGVSIAAISQRENGNFNK